ncbi:AI-2E family transporter [Phycicoccus endophyticus]|uniref:AI-2E family transporter n=1 Tax=Phycicoccus endophyticus TaxID=1690220 RepID=A0A7G9R1Z7_9MICO|nr:AI-2E family transporter [Phycicoccus endophyticus]NHI19747.1 AI-2E family transporter [Phycicoccus endophyticus]QNN49622.1 AI-2E family transporter [Phycicoccus endophyticus]GGL33408.1 AI-2E family transporter [Phycicoccus endophyticus]
MTASTPGPMTPVALPRGVLILVGLAAATVSVAGLHGVSGILGPAFLAVVLCIAAAPVRSVAERLGAPAWVGTLLTVLVVYLVIVVLAGSMVVAAARFAALVPDYQDELRKVLDGVARWLADLGVGNGQVSAILDSFDLRRLAGLVTTVLSGTLSLVTNLAFVVTLVLFVVLDAGSFGRHLAVIRQHRPAFVEALDSFARGTRTYLLVSTVFGLVVAVVDTLLLWALGVPGALLWGLLAFVTNYVPNIGFVLGLVPPAVLALLEGGPGLALGVVVAYSVVNVVIQSIIQPKLVGDAVGLSASVTFLSLVVWAWILGPVGAVLAVPLTLLVRELFIDVDPNTRWLRGLIGTSGTTASDPPDPPTTTSGS